MGAHDQHATRRLQPAPKTNRIGLQVIDYRGGKTTLCAGCGHNAISERIIDAMYEMGVQPERVAKFSGIGCSSKSPAYFMNRSHSFNSVHGRMPSVATGAMLANKNLDCARSDRRRRHGFDRRRTVHSPDATQSADHLRDRRQRVLRFDEGPVLGHRRSWVDVEERSGERSAAGGYLRHGNSIGRNVRGAFVLRRQATTAHHAEGSDRASTVR